MTTAIIMALVMGGLFLIAIIASQMLSCDACPFHDHCKLLEEEGYLNICAQEIFRSNNGNEH